MDMMKEEKVWELLNLSPTWRFPRKSSHHIVGLPNCRAHVTFHSFFPGSSLMNTFHRNCREEAIFSTRLRTLSFEIREIAARRIVIGRSSLEERPR
jgi:hypothetical protein